MFRGTWHADVEDGGCRLAFDAEFDLGMPSLSHVLDPIAVETVEDAVAAVLRALFGDDRPVQFTDAAAEEPVDARRP